MIGVITLSRGLHRKLNGEFRLTARVTHCYLYLLTSSLAPRVHFQNVELILI